MTHKHTPTPWEISGRCNGVVIARIQNPNITDKHLNIRYKNIAFCNSNITENWSSDECEANAEHIVKCVNSHDELLEALENLFECCMAELDEDGNIINEGFSSKSALGIAQSVIKKAKGQVNAT